MDACFVVDHHARFSTGAAAGEWRGGRCLFPGKGRLAAVADDSAVGAAVGSIRYPLGGGFGFICFTRSRAVGDADVDEYAGGIGTGALVCPVYHQI